jgi:hypothetical protein
MGITLEAWARYDWHGRSIEYHRSQIRQHWGFREVTLADAHALITWLCEHVLVPTRRPEHLKYVHILKSRSPQSPYNW